MHASEAECSLMYVTLRHISFGSCSQQLAKFLYSFLCLFIRVLAASNSQNFYIPFSVCLSGFLQPATRKIFIFLSLSVYQGSCSQQLAKLLYSFLCLFIRVLAASNSQNCYIPFSVCLSGFLQPATRKIFIFLSLSVYQGSCSQQHGKLLYSFLYLFIRVLAASNSQHFYIPFSVCLSGFLAAILVFSRI